MDTCPQCGYKENVKSKTMSNHMNNYAYAEGPNAGKVWGTLNSNDIYVTIPANEEKHIPVIKVVRVDKYNQNSALEFEQQVNKQVSANRFETEVAKTQITSEAYVAARESERVAAAQDVVNQASQHAQNVINQTSATAKAPAKPIVVPTTVPVETLNKAIEKSETPVKPTVIPPSKPAITP